MKIYLKNATKVKEKYVPENSVYEKSVGESHNKYKYDNVVRIAYGNSSEHTETDTTVVGGTSLTLHTQTLNQTGSWSHSSSSVMANNDTNMSTITSFTNISVNDGLRNTTTQVALTPVDISKFYYSIIGDDHSSLCPNGTLFTLSSENASFFGNCTTLTSEEDAFMMHRHPALGVFLTLFAMFTVVGNICVMIAVARERYLRTVTNYFVVSLAIADLVIGGVVMPFSICQEMTNQYWLFGSDWCDVWHSFDVLASTASILNLSVIALDRYWAITDPISYPCKMSTGRAFVLIALVWICSAAISFPAILWWRSVATDTAPAHVCAFTEDPGYLIFSSIISFYVPIFIIMFAYYKIYKAATEQIRSLKAGAKVMHSNGVDGEVMTLRIHRGGGARFAEDVHYHRTANSDSENESPSHLIRSHRANDDDERPSRMMSRKWKNFHLSRKISKIAKEQKAAKTLGIVMGVFCICWVPFFVTNTLYGICHLNCVLHAEVVFPVFTWLGYLNSGMNPVIYAASMRDFRRAFSKILCCCCPRYRFNSRKGYYDTSLQCATSSFVLTGERCSK